MNPEGQNSGAEFTIKTQLVRETQLMISKLKALGLNEPTAPGMMVFGEPNDEIAILLGGIPNPKDSTGEKHLVVSPKGLFLANNKRGNSAVTERPDDFLILGLQVGMEEGKIVAVSIDEKKHELRIDNELTNPVASLFNIERVNSTPEEFVGLLKLAIEASRNIVQKPLTDAIANAKASNNILDTMIQQEKPTSPQPPANPGPTV